MEACGGRTDVANPTLGPLRFRDAARARSAAGPRWYDAGPGGVAELGRRARFRSVWAYARGGSNPLAPTLIGPAQPTGYRATGMGVIEVEGLRKEYRRLRGGRTTAVDGLDLDVPEGGVFGFLGPNGAGKTTTIRCLLGLVRPSGGRTRLMGADVPRSLAGVIGAVGSIVEQPALFPRFSGRRNLQILGRVGGHDDAAIERVLSRVGLADRGGDAVRTYSLGMKQRLGIAAALLKDPALLILDEPANGLDPAGIVEVRELIRSLGDEGRTVFVSSHILSEVEQTADRVAILARGRLITAGPVSARSCRRAASAACARSLADPVAGARALADAGIGADRGRRRPAHRPRTRSGRTRHARAGRAGAVRLGTASRRGGSRDGLPGADPGRRDRIRDRAPPRRTAAGMVPTCGPGPRDRGRRVDRGQPRDRHVQRIAALRRGRSTRPRGRLPPRQRRSAVASCRRGTTATSPPTAPSRYGRSTTASSQWRWSRSAGRAHVRDVLDRRAARRVLLGATLSGADWTAGTMGTLLTWEPRRIRVHLVRCW